MSAARTDRRYAESTAERGPSGPVRRSKSEPMSAARTDACMPNRQRSVAERPGRRSKSGTDSISTNDLKNGMALNLPDGLMTVWSSST